MWGPGWAELFRNGPTIAETTAYVHEPGLWAAHWTYDDHGDVHRLSCSHIHQTRRAAEDCARNVNSMVDRMLREQKPYGTSYVAERLWRNPNHQYLGVQKEEEIA